MADFKTHLTVGCSAVGIASACLLAGDAAKPEEIILYFALGSAGAALPDIDSDSSTPLKITFHVLSLVIAFLVTFSQRLGDTAAEFLIIWAAAYVTVRYLIFELFTRLTIHRGVFHSIPAGALFWFIATIALYRVARVSTLTAWMGGFFVFIGYIVHLLLDEVYSFDFKNMKAKNSFGTGLKIISLYDIKATLLLYVATIFFFWLAPSADPFVRFITNSDFYEAIRFFPRGGWFEGVSY